MIAFDGYIHLFGDCSKCGHTEWIDLEPCYNNDDELLTLDATCGNCGHSPQVDMNNLKEPNMDRDDG